MNGKENVVDIRKIGNTVIKICDDHCRDSSAADTEKILTKTARDALIALSDPTQAPNTTTPEETR